MLGNTQSITCAFCHADSAKPLFLVPPKRRPKEGRQLPRRLTGCLLANRHFIINQSFLKNKTISIDNVSLSYGNKPILENCTARLDMSKITLVRGKNGVGKTSLVRLIIGSYECASGKITVGGVKPSALPSGAFPRHIFCLPQHDGVWNFTAFEIYDADLSENADDALECAADRKICLRGGGLFENEA